MRTKLFNRQSLKAFFGQGARPKESHFAVLIDSMVNKLEDGISKTPEDGLILSSEGKTSDRVLSFYDRIDDELPQWSLELDKTASNGLSLVAPREEAAAHTAIHFQKSGNVGIGTRQPRTTVEVDGTLGVDTRIGTHKLATVPADGRWHDVLTNLEACVALEIVAFVGKAGTRKYALLHAHAMSTFGRSHHKIRKTQAYYGWCWNKIAIRFTRSTHQYSLQLKTRSNYGPGQKICFHITNLWNNDIMKLFT